MNGVAWFYCAGQHLGWDKYVPGEGNPVSISVYKNITGKYILSTDVTGKYYLDFPVRTLQDAGRYRCKYVPLPTLYRDAELVVLGETKM